MRGQVISDPSKLAQSVFLRRLAIPTYALLRSLDNRLQKVRGLSDDGRSVGVILEDLAWHQRDLDGEAHDVLDEMTADDEESVRAQQRSKVAEVRTTDGFDRAARPRWQHARRIAETASHQAAAIPFAGSGASGRA